MDFSTIMDNSFWVIPIVIAVVQAIKMVGFPSKYSPLISIGVGAVLAFLVDEGQTLSHSLLSGVIYGLSASGLYSGVQTTQKVAQLKSGAIKLEDDDKRLLSENDIKEIEQMQANKKNNSENK